jgi:hypothetical protein
MERSNRLTKGIFEVNISFVEKRARFATFPKLEWAHQLNFLLLTRKRSNLF